MSTPDTPKPSRSHARTAFGFRWGVESALCAPRPLRVRARAWARMVDIPGRQRLDLGFHDSENLQLLRLRLVLQSLPFHPRRLHERLVIDSGRVDPNVE